VRWRYVLGGTLLLATGCILTTGQQVHQFNEEGVALLRRQQYAAAQERFQAALALAPEDVTTRFNLATAAHQAGDVPLAEATYRECIQRAPDHGPSHHGLALLMVQQGRSKEAWDCIEKWLAERPNLADAHAEYGWLTREGGDLPAAQARLQKALALDPGNVRALLELGQLYETYSYPDRARTLYERALQREPDQPEVVARLVGMRKSAGIKAADAP
jgi:Tfp pilus assembly protein PilF